MKSVVLRMVSMAVVMAAGSIFVPAQQPPPPKEVPGTKTPVNPGNPPNAQPVAIPCPRLDVRGMGAPIVRDGDAVNFTANLNGGDPNVQPLFSWSISAGVLKSGQGTRQIEVDSSGAGADRFIIVDLWVGGYASDCSLQAKAGVTVAGPARKVDEFGEMSVEKEKERLADFFSGLSPSHDIAYIIAYAGRTNVRGYARESLTRMRAAMSAAGMPTDKIATMDGGFRETPTYELWAVPVGAIAPKATPTVSAKDIVFPKPTPAPPRKRP